MHTDTHPWKRISGIWNSFKNALVWHCRRSCAPIKPNHAAKCAYYEQNVFFAELLVFTYRTTMGWGGASWASLTPNTDNQSPETNCPPIQPAAAAGALRLRETVKHVAGGRVQDDVAC